VLAALNASRDGLSSAVAAQRLARSGPNEVARDSRRRPVEIILAQFSNRLVILLMIAAAISLVLGERVEAAVILAIVVVNAGLGFIQEYRAERALRQLRRFVTHTARVRRDGRVVELSAAALVPGDMVRLAIGDMVPADVRLLAVDDLACDEGALTGESLPAQKDTAPLEPGRDLLHERRNEAFLGTTVASGYGEGVVFATGRDTVLGHTAATLAACHPETDFQRNIRRFSDLLFKVTLAMTAFVFLANAVLAKGLFDSFLFALALAVGITPEALPVIVTIALSRGALRMAKAKVIIKRLVSVEDLGNIDVLCCDKTGTLTQGEVALADYADLAGTRDRAIVLYGLLCSAPEAAEGLATPGSSIRRGSAAGRLHRRGRAARYRRAPTGAR